MAKKPTKAATNKQPKSTKNQSQQLVGLKAAIAQANQVYGDGTIFYGNTVVDVAAISTGIMTLDKALGCYGWPRGRFAEIFGPESSGKTTVCLEAIASAQRTARPDGQLGVCAFIDVEHALDPTWARNIGVDMDSVLLSQPSSGEEAFHVLEMLVKSNEVDLVVVDSIAGMVPKAERDGELADNHIGLHARLMSSGLRRLKEMVHKSGTAVIFTNQIRHKIGIMFGCLHGDTLVNFVDGRAIPIGQVVAERIDGEVWSYNAESRTFEPRRIVDWHDNGVVSSSKDFLTVTAIGPGNKSGCMSVTVTPDHEVMTDDGWRPMKKLIVGDRIMTKYTSILNGGLGDFMSGVLVGDHYLCRMSGHLSACVKLRDSIDHEYVEWKADKLNALGFKRRDFQKYTMFESAFSYELGLHKDRYPNRDPMALLDAFNWLGMAIWIMDDAVYNRDRYQLSIKRLRGNDEKLEQISRAFDVLGLYHYISRGGTVTFDKAVSNHIAEQISTFVPPCMQRKLPEHLRGRYMDFVLDSTKRQLATYAVIKSIRQASVHKMKRKGKYDISVDGNACYLAGGQHNGLLVHNSPEVTSGGLAMKFYASVRIDLRRKEKITKGKDEQNKPVGNNVLAKIIKNKVAPPFQEASFDIYYGLTLDGRVVYGADKAAALLEVGLAEGIIDRNGCNYYIGDERLGKSRDDAIATLSDEGTEFAGKVRAKLQVAHRRVEVSDLSDDEVADMVNNLDDA